MDQNNNNNNQSNNNNPATGEKTFTQEQLNAIIGERLAKERAKSEAEFAEREKTLRQRELAIIAREKLEEAGLNKDLCNVLRYDDEESLDKAIVQLKSMQGFKNNENSEYKPLEIIPNNLPAVDPWLQRDNPDRALRKAMGLPTK